MKNILCSSLIGCFFLLIFASCQNKNEMLNTGTWRAVLKLRADVSLPLNFELKKIQDKYLLEIINADEKIAVDEISIINDSIFIKLPLFDSEIKGKFDANSITGAWFNYSRKENISIPFEAKFGIDFRFTNETKTPMANISGRWETDFSKGTEDSSKAIGVFVQSANSLTGTFLTPTGDYRYLAGTVQGDSVMLSCFDGSHAFLFRAKIDEHGNLNGDFHSGNHWLEPWTAKRNEQFQLPNPDSLTFLKSGYDKVNFSFPDLDNKPVSLSDKRFEGKVVIVQIMGTWCPNCMDETNFLSSYYAKHKSENLEIIGLGYEKTSDFSKAKSSLERLKKRFNVEYTLLFAGSSKKEEAAKTLPMLNHIMSFPTTIFIDKKGKVRKIHTGFSGPATGNEYEKFKEEFSSFVEKLIAE